MSLMKRIIKLCQPLMRLLYRKQHFAHAILYLTGLPSVYHTVPHELIIYHKLLQIMRMFILLDSCLLSRSTMKLANYVTSFFLSHIPQT